jgi:uncharacterized membrane protein
MKPTRKLPQAQNPLTPDKRHEVRTAGASGSGESHLVVEARSQQFKGPLPHPEILAQYDHIVPGCAKSIIESFIAEGDHRRECQKREVAMHEDWARADVALQRRGQILGFILAVIGIGGGLGVAAFGAPVSGTIVSGASLAAIVIAFLRQKRTEKEEPEAIEKSDRAIAESPPQTGRGV